MSKLILLMDICVTFMFLGGICTGGKKTLLFTKLWKSIVVCRCKLCIEIKHTERPKRDKKLSQMENWLKVLLRDRRTQGLSQIMTYDVWLTMVFIVNTLFWRGRSKTVQSKMCSLNRATSGTSWGVPETADTEFISLLLLSAPDWGDALLNAWRTFFFSFPCIIKFPKAKIAASVRICI